MSIYQHLISVKNTAEYLEDQLEALPISLLYTLELNTLIERHIRMLLTDDFNEHDDLRRYIAGMVVPDLADPITDTTHDMLLFDLRHFMCLEDEVVIDVRVSPCYDVLISIEPVHVLN